MDVSGLEFATAAARGRIAAAESGYELAWRLPQVATATGNVTPFARIDVLAAAAGVLSSLSARDRAVLRRAAVETTRYAIRTGRADGLLAKDYCAAGGSVAIASADEVRAVAAAIAPITTSLERDPRTRRVPAEDGGSPQPGRRRSVQAMPALGTDLVSVGPTPT